MELIESDLRMIISVFAQLECLATIDGVHDVEIRVKNECDDVIVIGYGENGDPAILAIEIPDDLKKVIITPNVPYYPIPIYPTVPTYPAPNTPWITWNTSDTGNPPPDDGHRILCCDQKLDGTDADYDQLYGNRY